MLILACCLFTNSMRSLTDQVVWIFCHPVQFDGLLADLGVELGALALETFGFSLSGSAAEDARGSLSHCLLPVGNLNRVDVEFLGDLLDCLMPLSASSATRALNSGSCLLRLPFTMCVFGSDLMPLPHTTIIA
jgi:hypothetical protein